MDNLHTNSMGYTDGDVDTNHSDNPSLNSIVADRYSRRQTLFGGASASAVAFLGTSMLAGCGDDDDKAFGNIGVGAGAITSSAGRLVSLNGTVSDSDGVASAVWTQTSGPTVTLTQTSQAVATFLAPGVAAATDLGFTLTATDSKGNTGTVTKTVTIMPATLGFAAVAKNKNDIVTVPAGYSVQIGTRLGDPIIAGVAAYANNGSDTDFASRIGDHCDALTWYGLNAAGARDDNASTRGLIVQNHENINQQYLHVGGATTTGGVRPEAEALKEIECHGVSVTEYAESTGRKWAYVQGGNLNRRITPHTETTFAGPVAGAPLLRTAHSPDGTAGRGTINNCANGHTAWATNLTCEENWAGYFRRLAGDNANRSAREVTQLSRYGIGEGAGGSYGWASVVAADPANTRFRRWNVTVDTTKPADGTGDFRNEQNQFGWVVEIDPYDKGSAPRKRTALGRFGHEGAWLGKLAEGKKLAIYMGDDSRNEYFYKFVSTASWVPGDAQASNRMAVGDKYLNAGTLYVAKFNADGTGSWLPLVHGQVPNRPAAGANPEYVFQDQNDILTFPRLAADAVGATKMDRPEWTALNNVTGEIYLTLTNNRTNERPITATDAANPRHYNDPKLAGAGTNPQGNPNGHIVRIRENGNDGAATVFTWDIYLFGADSADSDSNVNISGLTADNDFSSPDGIWFGRPQNASGQGKNLMWLQTDDGAFTDRTNNQMLAALPGTVGDGGVKTITNTGTGGPLQQTTRAGAAATAASLRRFLVGPVDCELTGVDTTPDGRTMFVGIQHPGENGTTAAPNSHWPDSQATGTAGATVRPRSAIAIITKDDGGLIGL